VLLNEDYIVSKFYQYAGYPKYNKITKSYSGGCPTCREGNSWGKKRRLYYIIKKNLVFCHNCGLSVRPVRWIQTVANLTYVEIMRENNQFSATPGNYTQDLVHDIKEPAVENVTSVLPEDSINLSDSIQIQYHKDNRYVKAALQLLTTRRLSNACNRPETFWVSLTDKVHKNRLIIPFYDVDGKIVHYQSRTLIENHAHPMPKYLSKQNSEKTLFGIDKVDVKRKAIFITEGPLDACFVKNGVAVAGINEGKGSVFTQKQENQLNQFNLLNKIWILDNQRVDKASKKKTAFLLKQGHSVFLWPTELGKIKDLNDVCIKHNITEISEKFILEHTYSGLKGSVTLAQIN
jgi:hypothetical protein